MKCSGSWVLQMKSLEILQTRFFNALQMKSLRIPQMRFLNELQMEVLLIFCRFSKLLFQPSVAFLLNRASPILRHSPNFGEAPFAGRIFLPSGVRSREIPSSGEHDDRSRARQEMSAESRIRVPPYFQCRRISQIRCPVRLAQRG